MAYVVRGIGSGSIPFKSLGKWLKDNGNNDELMFVHCKPASVSDEHEERYEKFRKDWFLGFATKKRYGKWFDLYQAWYLMEQ